MLTLFSMNFSGCLGTTVNFTIQFPVWFMNFSEERIKYKFDKLNQANYHSEQTNKQQPHKYNHYQSKYHDRVLISTKIYPDSLFSISCLVLLSLLLLTQWRTQCSANNKGGVHVHFILATDLIKNSSPPISTNIYAHPPL